MIILNVVDLVKFMLDSIANYVSVLVLMLMTFFLFTSAVTIISEKIGSVICTVLTVYRATIKIEKDEKND